MYGRVEEEKWVQMVELEKQRIELTKDLEFERTQFFVETLVQLEKMIFQK